MDKLLKDKGNDIKQKSADVDSYIKDAVVAKLPGNKSAVLGQKKGRKRAGYPC